MRAILHVSNPYRFYPNPSPFPSIVTMTLVFLPRSRYASHQAHHLHYRKSIILFVSLARYSSLFGFSLLSLFMTSSISASLCSKRQFIFSIDLCSSTSVAFSRSLLSFIPLLLSSSSTISFSYLLFSSHSAINSSCRSSPFGRTLRDFART